MLIQVYKSIHNMNIYSADTLKYGSMCRHVA